MKNHPLFSLLVLCAATQAACQTKVAETAFPGYRLAPSRVDFVWGEEIELQASLQYRPASEFVEYQSDNFPTLYCSLEGAAPVEVKRGDAVAPESSRRPFPLNYQSKQPMWPLEVGRWECWQVLTLSQFTNKGRGEGMRLKSESARFTILKPTHDDEAVLEEAGLLRAYIKRESPRKSITAFPQLIEKHPGSTYYCHSTKAGLMPHVDYLTSDRFLQADLSKQDANWGPSPYGLKVKETLDNLEKFNCREFTPQQFAVLRTYNALDNGDFPLARKSAGKGLALNPEPAPRAFFDFILRFRDESEWLKQFKSVRRITAGKSVGGSAL